ncbi:MAG TPA: thiamine pyrophosphate-dependent enzyme [Chloroflexota bacterium]|nr:thiamine pyrophosphate-dependent enzyme [Chloroflexota bacterium]
MAERPLSDRARVPVVMPKQGWTMEVGSVVEWRKRDGDLVRRGEILFVIQSDKATNEIEALESGVVRIPPESPPLGQEVPIGTVLAYIEPADLPAEPAPAPIAAPAAPARAEAPRARPSFTPTYQPITAERARGLYRTMLVIRKTEEALARAHQNGLVHGACHTYVGEEAIATGVCAHLTDADAVFSTHRGHGHALAKGVTPRELAAELFGRVGGCSRGRGGSMHIFKPEVGMMGTSGIVGPSIVLATGAGYTAKLLKTGAVGVAFFGDGASNNGAFHEGLNLAAIWDLPVLFVCENNLYATEVPFGTVAREPDVAARAAGYGIPGVVVDGNDVLAVYEAAGEAIRRARAGEGPTLLECKTYRTRAHSEGMREAGYRSLDEIAAWKARDPIPRLRQQLLANGAPEAELAAIEREVEAMAEDAVEWARNSPYPDPATVLENVYAE